MTMLDATSVDSDSFGGLGLVFLLFVLLVILSKPITVMAAKTIVSITTMEDRTNEDDQGDAKNDAELLVYAFDRTML